MRNLTYTALWAVCCLWACGPEYLYQEQKEIPSSQWSYRDTLDFSFQVQDTSALYDLSVEFVYADTFPEQNIYVKFYTRFPDGKRLSKALSFDLFDTEGQPVGNCRGGKCRALIPIQKNAYFNTAGEYLITIEQYGRREPVPGIRSIGLSVQQTGKK
jgi:gliding motility-associated lipoprotein GldH